jgi:hypothetical protein
VRFFKFNRSASRDPGIISVMVSDAIVTGEQDPVTFTSCLALCFPGLHSIRLCTSAHLFTYQNDLVTLDGQGIDVRVLGVLSPTRK